MKVDIDLKDGTKMKKLILFTGIEDVDTRIYDSSEVHEALNKSNGQIYYVGACSHGSMLINQIVNYRVLDEEDELEDRIRKFVKETSDIYDLEDTAEWIMYNKDELLRLLQL